MVELFQDSFSARRAEAREFGALHRHLDLYVDGVACWETRTFKFAPAAGSMQEHFSTILEGCVDYVSVGKSSNDGGYRTWRAASGASICLSKSTVRVTVSCEGGGKRPVWDGGVQTALLAVLHHHFSSDLIGMASDRGSSSPFEDLGSEFSQREARQKLAALVEATVRLDFHATHPHGGVNPFVGLCLGRKRLYGARTGNARTGFLRPGTYVVHSEAEFCSYDNYDPRLSKWSSQAVCVSAPLTVKLGAWTWSDLASTPTAQARTAFSSLRGAVRRGDLSALQPEVGFALELSTRS